MYLRKLEQALWFQRTSYNKQFKEARIPPRFRELAHLFLDMRFLLQVERSLSNRSEYSGSFLFHKLLGVLSDRYARTFQILKDLNVPMVAALKSPERAFTIFDPWTNWQMEYPPIQEEIYWLLNQDLSLPRLKQLNTLLNFNSSAFHDANHCIFALLIPPPTVQCSRDYFHFVEALAVAQERYIGLDLGPEFCKLFKAIGCISKMSPAKILMPGLTSPKIEFGGLLLTNLALLNHWSISEMQKQFPNWAPIVDNPDTKLSNAFTKQISPAWIKRKESLVYPPALRRRLTSRHPKLRLQNFELNCLLANESQLTKIWSWNQRLFWNN